MTVTITVTDYFSLYLFIIVDCRRVISAINTQQYNNSFNNPQKLTTRVQLQVRLIGQGNQSEI